MKLIFSLFIAMVLSITAFCQDNTSVLSIKQSKINTVTITDSVVLKSIQNFILLKKSTDSVFEKYGYIEVIFNQRYPPNTTITNRTFCFSVLASYYYFYKDFEPKEFPLYTTIIDNKLVIFYDTKFQNETINKKKKKYFIRKINSCLKPLIIEKVVNENGKKIKLRPSGDISLGESTPICFYE